MSAALDTRQADDLIQQIGSAIVSDESYAGRDWAGIAFVCIIEPGVRRLSSYSYDEAGKATPARPRDSNIDLLFQDLQTATKLEGKEPWKSVLFQIKRDEMKVKLQFEYVDATRWKVGPGNIDTLVPAMRP